MSLVPSFACALKSAAYPRRMLLPCLLAGMALSGCGSEMQDLEQYVAQVKARRPTGIGPMPEERPYLAFQYPIENLRDPFDPNALAADSRKLAAGGDSSLRPDPDHIPEFLEGFPLDTLRMVGTLQQGNVMWGLIKTPDRTIQRVTTGNFVGQNYGEIVSITATKIEVNELVPDGLGGFMRHETSIALSEEGN